MRCCFWLCLCLWMFLLLAREHLEDGGGRGGDEAGDAEAEGHAQGLDGVVSQQKGKEARRVGVVEEGVCCVWPLGRPEVEEAVGEHGGEPEGDAGEGALSSEVGVSR